MHIQYHETKELRRVEKGEVFQVLDEKEGTSVLLPNHRLFMMVQPYCDDETRYIVCLDDGTLYEVTANNSSFRVVILPGATVTNG